MTIWFISDTHFGHANILTFMTDEGSLVRPGFSSVEHMDEHIVARWNSAVRPDDVVYHLGDVTFGTVALLDRIMIRLNGRKRLILGNHDKLDANAYRRHFQKILSWRSFDSDVTGCEWTFVACHYPLHPSAFRHDPKMRRFCVHGHTHQRIVRDPGYVNVCVERTNYSPVSLEQVLHMGRESMSQAEAA